MPAELQPHIGLFPHVGLFPSAGGGSSVIGFSQFAVNHLSGVSNVTLTLTPTAGNALFALISVNSTVGLTVSDGLDGAWTADPAGAHFDAPTNSYLQFFELAVTSGGTKTVTLHTTGANAFGLSVWEFSNVSSTPFVYQGVYASVASNTNATSPTVSPLAGEAVLAACIVSSNTTTRTAGWTADATTALNGNEVDHKLYPAGVTNDAITWTGNGASTWNVAILRIAAATAQAPVYTDNPVGAASATGAANDSASFTNNPVGAASATGSNVESNSRALTFNDNPVGIATAKGGNSESWFRQGGAGRVTLGIVGTPILVESHVSGATLAQSITPNLGDDILIFAWWNDATTSTATISDTVDGAYTADAGGPHRHSAVIAESGQWFYHRGVTGNNRTVTLTVSGAVNNRGMLIWDISGVVQTGGSPYTFQYGDVSASLNASYPTVTLGAQQGLFAACVLGLNLSVASAGGGLILDGASNTGQVRGAFGHDITDQGSVTGTMTAASGTPDWLLGTAVVQGVPPSGGATGDFRFSFYDDAFSDNFSG